MPRRALRCSVDLSIHAITCPGVWLPRRDDVYLSVCMFGEVRRTQLIGACFPMLVQEKFHFDKVFYSAYEPAHVAELLLDEPAVVEVIQLSDIYEGGRLLASYECSANNFLYPYPTYSPSYGTQDREIIMERSLDFPGISPRLEFSTNTSIKETSAPFVPDYDDDVLRASRTRGTRTASPRRARSKTRRGAKSPSRISFGRPTVSSIGRSRSVSPSRRLRMDGLNLESSTSVRPLGESRPPFKVSKVEKDLIGRTPGSPSTQKGSTECTHGSYKWVNPGRKYAYTDDYLDLYTGNRRPTRWSTTLGRYLNDWETSSHLIDDLDALTIHRRYRSPSPVLHSSIIRARVDAAIERNETIAKVEREARERKERLERIEREERLDRLARMDTLTNSRYRYPLGESLPRVSISESLPRSYYYPSRYEYLPYTTTGSLELDLELARSRRRLYSDL